MKWDELKKLRIVLSTEGQLSGHVEWFKYVYNAEDVDEAIAELKGFAEDACLERDDNQTAIDELQAENRRLRRALWLARAERAKAMYTYWHVKCIEGHLLYEHKWIVVERLCRAKAEEYK